MKAKKQVSLVAGILALSTVFAGCSGTLNSNSGVQIDSAKTQVYVSAWNGGFGVDWLNEAAAKFNAAHSDAQVIINPNKDIYGSGIQPAIKAGVSLSDVFITAESSCIDLGIQGYLEDLSDIWASDADNNGKTVEQEMRDPELFKKVYQSENGIWGLPHNEAMQGFVYDHTIFMNKGYLMTESDGVTLTAGKDGKIGTYDDGQPTTIVEWDQMLQRMVGDGVYPFFINGMYAYDYIKSLEEALFAQYTGMKNYEISYSYDGEYTYMDGTKETITPATGYKTINVEEKKVVIDWISKYFFENSNYFHPSSKLASVSHTDAQALYVLGYQNTTSNPQSAMLYEGVWWENEARATFISLENRGVTEYKYGTRDYRYMLLPTMEGQRGANGDGTGSVMAISENGSIFLKKQTDETKRTLAKEFIKYLVSEEVSQIFTTSTGGLRPYYYEINDTHLSQMTTFAKNAYAVYNDTANVTTVRINPMKYYSEMNYFTSPTVSRWGSTVAGRNFTGIYTALQSVSKDQYYAGLASFGTAEYWAPIYEKYLAL